MSDLKSEVLQTKERRSERRKRLNVDVSEDLHQRIVAICKSRSLPVNKAVRAVLEKAFPGT